MTVNSEEGPWPETIKLRDVLPENMLPSFLFGGVADILVPAASIRHRSQLLTAQVVAHSAMNEVLAAGGPESEGSLYDAIDAAMDADLIGKQECVVFKSLNKEASACKRRSI